MSMIQTSAPKLLYLLGLMAIGLVGPFGCSPAEQETSQRGSSIESSGTLSAGAKVVIPEGSTISGPEVQITDGDQATAEASIQAQLPEDVTAAYLVGPATYIKIDTDKSVTQDDIHALEVLLPLVDKDGNPIPEERVEHAFVSFNVVTVEGEGVSGLLTQSSGAVRIVDHQKGASLFTANKFARFKLKGIEGTYTIVWPRSGVGPKSDRQQTSTIAPQNAQPASSGADGDDAAGDGADDDGGDSEGGDSEGGDVVQSSVAFQGIRNPWIQKLQPFIIAFSDEVDIDPDTSTVSLGGVDTVSLARDSTDREQLLIVNPPELGWPSGLSQTIVATILDKSGAEVELPTLKVNVTNNIRYVVTDTERPLIFEGP